MGAVLMSDNEDTIPAPPVPSTNPIAELRRTLEESRVNIRSTPTRFHGVKLMEDGTFHDVTPPIYHKNVAEEWLQRARFAITYGTMFPDFCQKGHLKTTRGLCGMCLSGKGKE
jgi:hypothetical protein